MKTNLYDPFPLSETYLEKFSHHFKEGEKVRVKETGHTGKISHLDDKNKIHVELDSGHFISCAPFELEPSDFPAARTDAEKSVWKVSGGFADPMPIDTVQPAEEKLDDVSREMLSAFVKASGGLSRALKAASVSDHDRVLIKSAIENIVAHRVNCDPFGEIEEHNTRILRIMAEKYSGTSAGDTLAKRARPNLRVGQKVRSAHGGQLGTIAAITGHLVKVTFDDGSGESYNLMSSTMEILIPVEVAARNRDQRGFESDDF